MTLKEILLATTLACLSLSGWSAEIAMVTALAGKASLIVGKKENTELRSFIKLREVDKLSLKGNTRLQIVFFGTGRQETWQGTGTLDVGDTETKSLDGDLKAEVKVLPAILVKQLSKTPSAEDVGRTGMARSRETQMDGAVDAIERTYADFRQQADASDHSPELYLLASYFELREFAKLTARLEDIVRQYPDDGEISRLNSLYASAIATAQAAGKRASKN